VHKQTSLTTLIELAVKEADDIAKELQQATAERRNAQTQLDALHEYRLDYAQRLQHATESGLSAANYHNFRQFIATLDQAISQQNKVVQQLEHRIDAIRERWLAQKRRINSYEALQTRQHLRLQQQHNRREQRQSDEYSAALYRRLRQPS
jgi:flagellar FliJ protein